jgi:hypothetical protein
MTERYQDAEAFRNSLEQRIRNASREKGTPHDRLRKDVAFHRLIARFVAADDERWAIKGGVALLWRLAVDARATRDVDANWLGTTDDLEAFLDRVVEHEAGDWFEFEISPPRPLRGETEGGLRFGVTTRLAGREFAAFRLDVNLITHALPVEFVPIHLPLLTFAGIANLEVPMISVAQQLAEKLHAVTRTYSGGNSSRAKDAYDTVLLAQSDSLPDAGTLRKAIAETFAIRNTRLPVTAPELPNSWAETLRSLLTDFALRGVQKVTELDTAWSLLWGPILDDSASDSARWDPAALLWT